MFIKLYLIALPLFFLFDMVWLGMVASNFYKSQIGFLLSEQVNWIAAILFYLLFISGLVFFAILPAVEQKSFLKALLQGAFFGLLTYGTYDLTNLATLKNWPLFITLVDVAWGTTLGALVSTATYLVSSKVL
jgi:uncharacterized membrane protein